MDNFIRRFRPVIIAAGLLLFLFSCSQHLLAQNKGLTNTATTTEKPASVANPVCLIMPMTGPHRACALWDEGTRWRLGNTLPAPPAPKKLVYWNGTEVGTAAAADVLPAQTGNAGKILSTDGTDPVWTDAPTAETQVINNYIEVGSPTPVPGGTTPGYGNFKKLFKDGIAIDPLPDQTGNGGKFLSTNGTATAWTATLPDQTGNSGKFLSTNGTVSAWTAAVITIASGTTALSTGAIASLACNTSTTAATGVLTTDVISWTPNADITGVTGYVPSTSGGLSIYPYPTADNVNFKVCNPTSNPITPGAVTLNWRVSR